MKTKRLFDLDNILMNFIHNHLSASTREPHGEVLRRDVEHRAVALNQGATDEFQALARFINETDMRRHREQQDLCNALAFLYSNTLTIKSIFLFLYDQNMLWLFVFPQVCQGGFSSDHSHFQKR